MDPKTKQAFIERFSAYLDTETPSERETISNEVDLYRLFVELAALKAEVKTESRQVKTAIDEFQNLIAMLQRNNDQLATELAGKQLQQEKQLEKTERPLLLAILDIRDRIEIGVKQSAAYQPGWRARRERTALAHIASLQQGMEITLRRLDGLLERYSVKPISTVGKRLDPHCMQVSDTEWQNAQEEGVVLADVRKGYLRHGKVLRIAEVIVNKSK
ncbi:MAG TPA: nucleotide exchange factor GrpE [Gammaproteobacteria bacterium]|nr:nucleotide exchange factor GrpE [Gammaproteobacteria bacterium]